MPRTRFDELVTLAEEHDGLLPLSKPGTLALPTPFCPDSRSVAGSNEEGEASTAYRTFPLTGSRNTVRPSFGRRPTGARTRLRYRMKLR
jgi:hypothetical protein